VRRKKPPWAVMRALTNLLGKVSVRGVERLQVGPLGIRLYRPAGVLAATPALVWMHGGGFVFGSAAQDHLFHDEDLGYADLLRAAGVPCDVHVVEGAFHGFDTVAPKSGPARAFRDAQVESLGDALGRS
jgi:acetyl esterase/lipase